jgi:hypothetical protein
MFITPKSLTITQLLSSESEQYLVPAYQRRYSWHEKQLVELLDDISLLEGGDTHLFGSIVCLTGHHTAGMNKLELVDGQQRLTTVCILLQCIADRLKKDGETSAAQDVDRLLQAKALGEPPVLKILLDSLDAGDFEKLLANKTLDQPQNPNLALAFSTFRDWVDDKKLADLGTFLYRLKNQCTVIRLEVSDAKDAFKLFETINNRGLKLSPTDIIKNFILGNAARFGPASLELARQRWAELIRNLDGTSIDGFFRQFLIARMRKRVTASFVIPYFKALFMRGVVEAAQLPERHWYADDIEIDENDDENDTAENGDVSPPPTIETDVQPISFADFLAGLIKYARVYGQIVLAKTGAPQTDRRLRSLRMIKSLQTYGFLMHLQVGGCDSANFETILRLTEALMVRRHTCRERSNENERLFARLCSVDATNPVAEVIAEFRRYSPPDDRFREAFSKAQYSSNLIERARYCLEQFEYQRQGKFPELIVGGSESVHVEHIIPQKIKTQKAKKDFGDWSEYLGHKSDALHPDYVSRIGNLTLFAGPLNIGASNNPYERKKFAFKDSAIKLTNSLIDEYPEFKFEHVDDRSAKLADLAVTLWPVP